MLRKLEQVGLRVGIGKEQTYNPMLLFADRAPSVFSRACAGLLVDYMVVKGVLSPSSLKMAPPEGFEPLTTWFGANDLASGNVLSIK